MCRAPVTLGGGMTIVNLGFLEPSSGVKKPHFSHHWYQAASTALGVYALGISPETFFFSPTGVAHACAGSGDKRTAELEKDFGKREIRSQRMSYQRNRKSVFFCATSRHRCCNRRGWHATQRDSISANRADAVISVLKHHVVLCGVEEGRLPFRPRPVTPASQGGPANDCHAPTRWRRAHQPLPPLPCQPSGPVRRRETKCEPQHTKR